MSKKIEVMMGVAWLGLLLSMFLLVLGLLQEAKAHPVDDPCEDPSAFGQTCQPIYGPLADPFFFDLHKEYWHVRREIVTHDINHYAQCVGRVRVREERCYGAAFTTGTPDILDYWAVIPAHPVIDWGVVNGPLATYFVVDSIVAAYATRANFQYHVYLCGQYEQSLKNVGC